MPAEAPRPRAISLESSSDEDSAVDAGAGTSKHPPLRLSPSNSRAPTRIAAPAPVLATASAKGHGITLSVSVGTGTPRPQSSSPRKQRGAPSPLVTSPPTASAPLPSTSTSPVSNLADDLNGMHVPSASAKASPRWWVVICKTDGAKRTTASLPAAHRWLAEAEAAGMDAHLELAETEEELATVLRTTKETTGPKQEKPGNPGIWHGARKNFLASYLDRYLGGGKNNGISFVSGVIDEYLKTFPYHFNDSAEIPDDVTDKDRCLQLDAEAKQRARQKADQQIRSWFKNQATKQNSVTKNPFRAFLAQGLKTLSTVKPRHEAEHKMWMKQPEYRNVLAPIFQERWAAQTLGSTQELAYRVQVAQEVYEEQDAGVKARVRKLVEEDYQRRVALRGQLGLATTSRPKVPTYVVRISRSLLSLYLKSYAAYATSMLELSYSLGHPARRVTNSRSSQISAELNRREEERLHNAKRRSCQASSDIDEDTHPSVHGSAGKGTSYLRSAEADRKRRRRHRRCQSGIDSYELSDGETSEESLDSGPVSDGEGEGGVEGASGAAAIPRSGKHARHGDVGEAPGTVGAAVDEFGMPMRDARGRKFSAHLRERLSRMLPQKRNALLADIDVMSDYELYRQETISKNECTLRAQFLQEGILTRDDPLWGEVTPKRVSQPLPPEGRTGAHEVDLHVNEQAPGVAPTLRLPSTPSAEVARERELQLPSHRQRGGLHDKRRQEQVIGGRENRGGQADGEQAGAGRIDKQTDDNRVDEHAGDGGIDKQADDEHIDEHEGNEHIDEHGGDECIDEHEGDERIDEHEGDERIDGQVGGEHVDEHEGSGCVDGLRDGQAHGKYSLRSGQQTREHGEQECTPGNGRGDDRRGASHDKRIDASQDRLLNTHPDERQDDGPRTGLDGNSHGASEVPAHARSTRARRRGARGASEKDVANKASPHSSILPVRDATTSSSSKKRRGDGGEHEGGACVEGPGDIFTHSRSGWPDWLALAVDNLALDAELDSEAKKSWTKLVATWWLIERHGDFAKDKRVPSNKHRPEEIGDWIKRARSTSYMPQPPDNQPSEDFADDWATSMWAWWSSLNPRWHKRNVDGKVSWADKKGGSWLDLYYPGLNGILSVLKGIMWWFELEGKPRGSRAWLELVYDAQWALEGVLHELRSHRSPDNEAGRASKRRKTK
ncbi:hypothetical protein HDZ31DRAFT_76635 [Schizophyllum fasciatum]